MKKELAVVKLCHYQLLQHFAISSLSPDPFKVTTIVAIPQSGRDKTNPRSYKIISLLSTLGKGLEPSLLNIPPRRLWNWALSHGGIEGRKELSGENRDTYHIR